MITLYIFVSAVFLSIIIGGYFLWKNMISTLEKLGDSVRSGLNGEVQQTALAYSVKKSVKENEQRPTILRSDGKNIVEKEKLVRIEDMPFDEAYGVLEEVAKNGDI